MAAGDDARTDNFGIVAFINPHTTASTIILLVVTIASLTGTGMALVRMMQRHRPSNLRVAVMQVASARVALLPALYATWSAFQILFVNYAHYINVLLSFYEGLSMYCFYALCVIFVGGESRVARILDERSAKMEQHASGCLSSNAILRFRLCGIPCCCVARSSMHRVHQYRYLIMQWMWTKAALSLAKAVYESWQHASGTHPTKPDVTKLVISILSVAVVVLIASGMLPFFRSVRPHLDGLAAEKKFLLIKVYVLLVVLNEWLWGFLVSSGELDAIITRKHVNFTGRGIAWTKLQMSIYWENVIAIVVSLAFVVPFLFVFRPDVVSVQSDDCNDDAVELEEGTPEELKTKRQLELEKIYERHQTFICWPLGALGLIRFIFMPVEAAWMHET